MLFYKKVGAKKKNDNYVMYNEYLIKCFKPIHICVISSTEGFNDINDHDDENIKEIKFSFACLFHKINLDFYRRKF